MIDNAMMDRQQELLVADEIEVAKKRETLRQELGAVSCHSAWHPCDFYPYLELTKGAEGLRDKDVLLLSKLHWGHRLQRPIEQYALRLNPALTVVRRDDGTVGKDNPNFLHNEEHGIAGHLDLRLRLKHKETLAGEIKSWNAEVCSTIWEKWRTGHDVFDYLADPGPARPWLQSAAGQILLYIWLLHLRDKAVKRGYLWITDKDTGWLFPELVHMDEYDFLLDDILKRVRRIHKAARGDTNAEGARCKAYRTDNWDLCVRCPRLLQCAPERVATIPDVIHDPELEELVRTMARCKADAETYEKADKKFKKLAKDRMRQYQPSDTEEKFKGSMRLGDTGFALQSHWYHVSDSIKELSKEEKKAGRIVTRKGYWCHKPTVLPLPSDIDLE